MGIFEESHDPLKETLLDKEDDSLILHCQNCGFHRRIMRTLCAVVTLLALLSSILLYKELQPPSTDKPVKSEYARLSRDLPLALTTIDHENTTPEEEWQAQIEGDGVVALTDEYTSSMNLPTAQRWPWSSDKGIYILQGHHNLHCLKMIRGSLLEFRSKIAQTQHHTHIDHCLTQLREDILCNADDTPRYTGGHFKQVGSGQGQLRLCRDWSKLDEWARQHSACFRDPDIFEVTEQFKFCPDGSEPWKVVEG